MKLSKSTTLLINICLVLVMAILLKALVATPRSVGAAIQREYAVWKCPEDDLGAGINKIAKEGWEFVAICPLTRDAYKKAIIFRR